MKGLKLEDINTISNSSGSTYENYLRRYQVIHRSIETTNLGKVSFNDFLNITSYFDLPTLYFGIYSMTFPGSTDFTITCGHCKQQIEVAIDNENLIQAKDDEAYSHIVKVLKEVRNPQKLLESSLVHKSERSMMPDSKMIIDIQTPSLRDHLNLLSTINEDSLDDLGNIFMILLFIKQIFFPDLEESARRNEPVYFTVDKKSEIFDIIKQLSTGDIKELNKGIDSYINKYIIEYRIKSFKCTNCKEDIGDIPIDMEDLLFQEILRL